MKHPAYYGLLAEFSDVEDLKEVAKAAYDAGYRKMDAYTPFPVEEVSEAIGFHRTRLPMIVLAGGLLGMLGGFTLQYWVSAIAYPLNIAGRAMGSWIAFVVPAYECTILGAALSAVFGMLALNGLPQPYHPLFNIAEFSQVTRDKFYLCIEATDDKFEAAATRSLLEKFRPDNVWEVPH